MAQYFEVLSQSDGSLDQSHQFFNGNQENERTQVRYILADEGSQFPPQQFILSGDQVMVLESSQPQIQGVVIDQGHAYQTTNQQQFGTVVQSTGMNNQPAQQIFYMESNNSQTGESVQAVQTVIDQAAIQNPQQSTQSQPIVLNHSMAGSSSPNISNRQVLQGTPGQRPVVQIRTPARQGHIQVNQPPRPLVPPMRQGLPQQVRPHQSASLPMRSMPPQIQMRLRTPISQIRQPAQQQVQQQAPRAPALTQFQQAKQLSSLSRQMTALQQQKLQQTTQSVQQPQQSQQLVQQQQQPQQMVQQQQTSGQMLASQIQKGLSDFQQRHQQQIKISQEQESNPARHQAISIGKQIIKPLSEFQPFSGKGNDVDELDDHDPAMNSTPGQMVNYKKMLEQRQIGKNSILARLPSNIKVTATPTNQQQPAQTQQCTISQTIDQVVNQVNQQQSVPISQPPQAGQIPSANTATTHMTQTPQLPQKKPRASRAKNPPGTPRGQGGAARPRVQRMPALQQPFNSPRVAAPQQPAPGPRFPQQQSRFANQQLMQQQRALLQQQQQNAQSQPPAPVPLSPSQQHDSPTQQNGIPTVVATQSQMNSSQSQMNNSQSQMTNSQSQMTNSQAQVINTQSQLSNSSSQMTNSQSQVNNSSSQMTNSTQMTNNQSQINNSQSQITNSQSQMNYLITPPTPNRPRQQHPLPAYIPSSQIQQIIGMFQDNTPIAEEFSDSIRMLVLLENGEQRLITFTLPKEACTIQEILEQVNVPFTLETNIQVTEANTNGINYIVTVGNVSNFGYGNNEEEQESCEPESQQVAGLQSNQQIQQTPGRPFVSKSPTLSQGLSSSQPELTKPPSPELPRLIPGKLAVCSYCGYTGEDFNKCSRCTRKLADNVKSIEAPMKVDVFKSTPPEILKQLSNCGANTSLLISASTKSNSNPAPPNTNPLGKPEPVAKTSPKKKASKSKSVEPDSVVISSDEEEDEKKPVRMVNEQLLNKLGASISISPVTKEPSLSEIKKHVRKLSAEPTKCVKLALKCRTVRIGSYRFVPGDDVIIDTKCVIIKAPVVDNKSEIKTIRIDRGDIVKVLICFNKALPVIFYYLNIGAAPIIRDMLNLRKESGLYFDPIDEKEDSYRKITLLPDDILDEHKIIFQQLYGITPYNIIDELTAKEANDILIKACPKDSSSSSIGSFSEIRQILMYPKEGQGRLSINTEDYVCLAVDQFLNDKIIDFYLKYLWENLPPEKQEKVHIFSTFFYKRLTTKPTKAARKSHPFESDGTLTAAEKRHWRVRNWTKRFNIFDKDFIVVPINENAHWFLAIICFPAMMGPQTLDGKPYIPEPKIKRTKNKQAPIEVKKEKPITCDDPLLSDKDEADSEDSDMESDDSEESAAAATAAAAAAAAAAVAAAAVTPPPTPQPKGRNAPKVPIKQPTILIFDSLAGPSRCRVVATLRDYLTVEYKVKMDTERVFNRDVIKGTSCKVPQQNNFTDCGLYLLQYVEQFFKDPIKDYNIPIKGIDNWFDEIVVTKKREDICNLLKELMIESGADIKILPDIALPTLDGKLVERQETDRDHETGEEEQEDMFTDIEDSEMTDASSLNVSRLSEENNGTSKGEDSQENSSGGENSSHESFQSSPVKPCDSSIGEQSDIVTTVMQPAVLKPTLTEFPRQTNKDTLNYLKSKRIVRHKTVSDGPEFKKTKLDY